MIGKYKIIVLMTGFYLCLSTSIYAVEGEYGSKQELFSGFEREVQDIIDSSIEPLIKLDGVRGEEELYRIALSAEQSLAKGSFALSELKVPIALPDDTKIFLERAKEEISIGLKALEEGMNYYAQYIVKRSPAQYRKYIEKRDKGIRYVDGGLTTLASARLQLDDPGEPIRSVWETGKSHFYRLEKVIPRKRISNNN